VSRIYHGTPDEGQRIAAERLLDETGIDIDDPVAEARIGSRLAVMRLVRMQDVALAGQAVPQLATKAEGLDAGKGDPDRICIVAMRGESLAMEMGLQAFDSRAARHDPDAITAVVDIVRYASAQSFKTKVAAWRQRRFPTGHRTGETMTRQAVFIPGLWRPVLTLLLASVVIMGSPGPSTMSATAVGAAYGLRRSLPYAGGLILGTTAVLVAVAIGVVTLLLSMPHGAPVLAAVSVLYMLYLAFRIATAPPLAERRDDVAAPAFAGGFLLAIANPKAYLAIAAVFTGTRVFVADHALDAAVKTALLTLMIVIIHLCWLLVGASLSRVLRDPTASRIVNVSLAASLVAVTALGLAR